MASLDDVAQAMVKLDNRLGAQDEQQKQLQEMLQRLGETFTQRLDRAELSASQTASESLKAVTELNLKLAKAAETAASATADLKARIGFNSGTLGGGLPNSDDGDQ